MNDLITNNIIELTHGLDFLLDLDNTAYTDTSFSGTSIGKHTRHVLEFNQCFLQGLDTGVIQYHKRKRNRELEEDISLARKKITSLIHNMSQLDIPQDKKTDLFFEDYFHTQKGKKVLRIDTTVNSQLHYVAGHSTHHYAVMGLIATNLGQEVMYPYFGYSPATIQDVESMLHR